MFALLLAQSSCVNTMKLTRYKLDGADFLIPDGRMKLFKHIMKGIADGTHKIVAQVKEETNGGSFSIEPWVKWVQGIWSAGAKAKLQWTWASEQEEEQNIGIGIAGGAIVTPIGSIGIAFPVIYPAKDGSEQTVYLRIINTDAGTVILPSYHADTFVNLNQKLMSGQVQQVSLD